MKACTCLPVASLVVLLSGVVLAQDPVKVDSGHYKVFFENAGVRVLKISYRPGETSTMHQHPDSLVIVLAPSTVRFETPDGKTEERDLPMESGLYAPAATHRPANAGKTQMEAILVEFKTAAPGTATLPTSRPGMAMKVLAEGPRAMAYRTTAEPTFAEPAGTTHDYDQVVIALGAARMSLAIDGKPAKTNWARGDVQFIGRGTPHESKNVDGKPVDFVIVAIR